MKQTFKILRTKFLNEDESNPLSSVHIQMLDSTCSYTNSPQKGLQNMSFFSVIDGNTLIYPLGSCIAFHNFFQSNKIFANNVRNLNTQIDEENYTYQSKKSIESQQKSKDTEIEQYHNIVGMATNGLGKCHVAVASQSNYKKQLTISKYCINEEEVLTFFLKFESNIPGNKTLRIIQLIDIAYYNHNHILLLVKVSEDELTQGFSDISSLPEYKLLMITLNTTNTNKIVTKLSTEHPIIRFSIQEDKTILFLDRGISIFATQQFVCLHNMSKRSTLLSPSSLSDKIIRKQSIVLDYIYFESELKITLRLKGEADGKNHVIQCLWLTNNNKIYTINILECLLEKKSLSQTKYHSQTMKNLFYHKMIKVGKNLLVIEKNRIAITHFVIDQEGFKYVGNYVYTQYIENSGIQKRGIRNIQASKDQMHIIITVELYSQQSAGYYVENLLFNLSATAGNRKFLNLFTRILPSSVNSSTFRGMQSTLQSVSYLLIGSRITTFQYMNAHHCQFSKSSQPLISNSSIQTPKAIAVHPLGYQFLIVFDNVIKFYNKVNSKSQASDLNSDNLQIQNESEEIDEPRKIKMSQEQTLSLTQLWSEQYICHAAKYSASGTLALCCSQDSSVKIVIYDCYKFKPAKIIPLSHVHLSNRSIINRMEWSCGGGALIVFMGKNNKSHQAIGKHSKANTSENTAKTDHNRTCTDMIMINIFNGQKIREFQERDLSGLPNFKLKYLDYQWDTDRLIASVNLQLIADTLVLNKVNKQLGFKQKHKNFLLYANKNEKENYEVTDQGEDHELQYASLSNHRIIFMPQSISCIKICSTLNTVFLGGQSGNLYWTTYPLQISPVDYYSLSSPHSSFYKINSSEFHRMDLSDSKVTAIQLTNNYKFLVVNIWDRGYFTFKVKRSQSNIATGKWDNSVMNISNNSMNLVFQELGNPIFNTIVTTSASLYSRRKQMLKTLLEQRKSCFTDLQEFRKQYEEIYQKTLQDVSKQNKYKELKTINEEIQSLDEISTNQKNISANLCLLQNQFEQWRNCQVRKCENKLLQLYEQQRLQKSTLNNKILKYTNIYEQCLKQCDQNYSNIKNDIQSNYAQFETDFKLIVSNLSKFQSRLSYQSKMEVEQLQQEIELLKIKLKIEDQTAKEKINNIYLTISSLKKSNERYLYRRSFLEHKCRHFRQQFASNQQQHDKLKSLKSELQNQLGKLELKTEKKQKTLKNLLQINNALNKYRDIHDGSIELAMKQIEEIKTESSNSQGQIKQIMAELISVSKQNAANKQKIFDYDKALTQGKQELASVNKSVIIYRRAVSRVFQGLQENSMSQGSERSENKNTEAKTLKMRAIYEQFYVKDNLEKLLINPKDKDAKIIENATTINQDKIFSKNKKKETLKAERNIPQKDKELISPAEVAQQEQSEKVLKELQSHKDYINKNFNLLQTYNHRIKQQINLNLLRIQSQNYDLIGECNSRKSETVKKKKQLHQLIDMVKQTQIYLAQTKKQSDFNHDEDQAINSNQNNKVQKEAQFIKDIQKPIIRYAPLKNKSGNSRVTTANAQKRKGTMNGEGSKNLRLFSGRLQREPHNYTSVNIQNKKNNKNKDTPFSVFEKIRESHGKIKAQQTFEKNSRNVGCWRYQMRKMLDIRKVENGSKEKSEEDIEQAYNNTPCNASHTKSVRRIQTAMNRQQSTNFQEISHNNPLNNERVRQQEELVVKNNFFQKNKPMTADIKKKNIREMAKKQQMRSTLKSGSKQTTTGTRSKFSIII